MTHTVPAQIEVHAQDDPRGYRVIPVQNKKPQANYHFISVEWEGWTIEGEVPESESELVVYVGRDSFETGESRRNDAPVTGQADSPNQEYRDPTTLPIVVFAALAWEDIHVVSQDRGRVVNVREPVPTTRLEFVDPTVLTVSLDAVVQPDPDPWTDRESVTVLDVCADALSGSMAEQSSSILSLLEAE